MGFRIIPSIGNFVTVDFKRPAQPVFQALLKEGLIVRLVADYGLPNHLRITVGLPQQNARLLQALKRCLPLEHSSSQIVTHGSRLRFHGRAGRPAHRTVANAGRQIHFPSRAHARRDRGGPDTNRWFS